CVTVHEDNVFTVGSEKGRVFLNTRKEIQSDFHKFCNELPKPTKEGVQVGQRLPAEPPSDIFVLRKMVEEVFSVLYGEAVGKTGLVPVPYEQILKDPSSLSVHGLPEGFGAKFEQCLVVTCPNHDYCKAAFSSVAKKL
uniref:Uncharacterized protein n=1 Tax=Erpetoichthys calabaricus TaxID=27687 RepID=A0A8C4SVR2_ERPCA